MIISGSGYCRVRRMGYRFQGLGSRARLRQQDDRVFKRLRLDQVDQLRQHFLPLRRSVDRRELELDRRDREAFHLADVRATLSCLGRDRWDTQLPLHPVGLARADGHFPSQLGEPRRDATDDSVHEARHAVRIELAPTVRFAVKDDSHILAFESPGGPIG